MDIRSRHFDPMSSEEWIAFVQKNTFSSEELGWLYCCALINRFLLTDPENLPAVTKAFLECGMNPNQLVTEDKEDNHENAWCNIPLISATRIENDAAGVEALSLLLEAGGNPNTVHEFGDFNENVFEFYIEEEFVHGPDLEGGSFYGLLLCWAYGGKQQSGYEPFTMLIGAPRTIFKDYDRFWYAYGHHENDKNTLYVIEKETGKKAAKYHG